MYIFEIYFLIGIIVTGIFWYKKYRSEIEVFSDIHKLDSKEMMFAFFLYCLFLWPYYIIVYLKDKFNNK